ncbi:MAG: C4-dicarboxylate transporter DcuC [Alphaproteobacteria bacterium]|nr:C4-dicarboxylate transporter DcuC [Alphaproteobacteria bacterium]
MVWIGLIIVLITLYAIIKNYETRLTLFTSGLLMSAIALVPMGGIDAFIKELTNAGLVTTIITVLGFSYVMDNTGCSKHLVVMVSSVLKKVKIILIPGAVLLTFILNIALPSAAGAAAAIGTILIPMLIRNGVAPALAGSAVLLGTWGSVLSPGLMFNPQVAQIAGVDVMTVIATFARQVFIAAFVAAVILAIIAYIKKEAPSKNSKIVEEEKEDFKVNPLKALVPIVPIFLLIIGSKQIGLIPEISVPQAMIIGVMLGFIIVRKDIVANTKQFFKGMGDGMTDIVGLIAAAAIFTFGMGAVGLTDALIDIMKSSEHIARIAAAAGPFIFGAVSGSGNAAALAFNAAITPNAAQFGLGTIELGSMAQIAAGLGRTMSPVAGCAIICAKIAGVNPIELAKRNAIPTIVATIIVMLTLL